jgi:phage gp29-like protein
MGVCGVSCSREIDEAPPEMMIDVGAELLRQNDWSEGTRLQDLSWLNLKYQHKSYYQLRLHYRSLMHWIYAKCR